MISQLHDGQLQWGARNVQRGPCYNHTEPSDLRAREWNEEGGGGGEARGCFFVNEEEEEEETYSVGFVQI